MTHLELIEYKAEQYARDIIPVVIGLDIGHRYSSQVSIEFPTPLNNEQWQLVSQGWVGHIALSRNFGITIRSKVPIQNLFRMIAYAYRLKIEFTSGLYECASLEELFGQIAKILSLKILDRGRKGYYRNYLPMSEQIPYISGRMDIYRKISKPWNLTFHCRFEEHTADLEDNQILAWTLNKIARTNICSDQAHQIVLKAYRELQRLVSIVPFNGQACASRLYNRLNEDYQPLHALCRFFLENSGPTHIAGDKSMIPFLVEMAHLFELFVSEWLRVHLPNQYSLKAQEKVEITDNGSIFFKIDLVIYDSITNAPICVLDTKYKRNQGPSSDDIQQVVTYAISKRCTKAFLLYPVEVNNHQLVKVGDVNVHSLSFKLDADLERSGQALLADLVARLRLVQ